MIRKLLRNKKLVGGLGPAVLTSLAGQAIYHYRSRHSGTNDVTNQTSRGAHADLNGDVNEMLRGAKRWLRQNHASDRMKEVLDRWLAEDSYRTSEVIDVSAKSNRRGR